MEPNKREFWWLVALQACLCFSLSCWEATAPWAEPASHPIRFAIVLILASSLATLACHIGPALFAARFGGLRSALRGLSHSGSPPDMSNGCLVLSLVSEVLYACFQPRCF